MLRGLQQLRIIGEGSAWNHSRTTMMQLRTKKKKSAAPKRTEVRSDVKDLIDLDKYDTTMQNTLESLTSSYARLRSGVLSPSYLDDISVEAYGSRTTLKSLAQVSVRDGRTMFVTTFDEQVSSAVEKAIRNAGLSLNPITEGKGRLRIPISKPSKESRLAMKEIAQKEAEAAKVATRMVRRKALEEVKKVKDDISKDDVKRLENGIQRMTDEFIGKIDAMQQSKVGVIMEPGLAVRK